MNLNGMYRLCLLFSGAIALMLPLDLSRGGMNRFTGTTTGVRVIRASHDDATIRAVSLDCQHVRRTPMWLEAGEGWAQMPSHQIDLTWPAQPGKSLTLSLSHQRGHASGCWDPVFFMSRRWYPESITGVPPDGGKPGDPPVVVPGKPCIDCADTPGHPSPQPNPTVTVPGSHQLCVGATGVWEYIAFENNFPSNGWCTWMFWRTQFGSQKLWVSYRESTDEWSHILDLFQGAVSMVGNTKLQCVAGVITGRVDLIATNQFMQCQTAIAVLG